MSLKIICEDCFIIKFISLLYITLNLIILKTSLLTMYWTVVMVSITKNLNLNMNKINRNPI